MISNPSSSSSPTPFTFPSFRLSTSKRRSCQRKPKRQVPPTALLIMANDNLRAFTLPEHLWGVHLDPDQPTIEQLEGLGVKVRDFGVLRPIKASPKKVDELRADDVVVSRSMSLSADGNADTVSGVEEQPIESSEPLSSESTVVPRDSSISEVMAAFAADGQSCTEDAGRFSSLSVAFLDR
ncbi:hypothetical protein FISHEDRAFT_72815 [Fistulina hepatica ATCC 64428]|nr:hypothetical protein FISHEDRAFT_72815 [Fistulina hepatica ATCC 64428]